MAEPEMTPASRQTPEGYISKDIYILSYIQISPFLEHDILRI
jgi:hypothetical protein